MQELSYFDYASLIKANSYDDYDLAQMCKERSDLEDWLKRFKPKIYKRVKAILVVEDLANLQEKG